MSDPGVLFDMGEPMTKSDLTQLLFPYVQVGPTDQDIQATGGGVCGFAFLTDGEETDHQELTLHLITYRNGRQRRYIPVSIVPQEMLDSLRRMYPFLNHLYLATFDMTAELYRIAGLQRGMHATMQAQKEMLNSALDENSKLSVIVYGNKIASDLEGSNCNIPMASPSSQDTINLDECEKLSPVLHELITEHAEMRKTLNRVSLRDGYYMPMMKKMIVGLMARMARTRDRFRKIANILNELDSECPRDPGLKMVTTTLRLLLHHETEEAASLVALFDQFKDMWIEWATNCEQNKVSPEMIPARDTDLEIVDV